MCVESINMINLTYDERLAVVYTVPKIIKGYMGNEVPKRIKITPEDLIVKSKFIIQVYILYIYIYISAMFSIRIFILR